MGCVETEFSGCQANNTNFISSPYDIVSRYFRKPWSTAEFIISAILRVSRLLKCISVPSSRKLAGSARIVFQIISPSSNVCTRLLKSPMEKKGGEWRKKFHRRGNALKECAEIETSFAKWMNIQLIAQNWFCILIRGAVKWQFKIFEYSINLASRWMNALMLPQYRVEINVGMILGEKMSIEKIFCKGVKWEQVFGCKSKFFSLSGQTSCFEAFFDVTFTLSNEV